MFFWGLNPPNEDAIQSKQKPCHSWYNMLSWCFFDFFLKQPKDTPLFQQKHSPLRNCSDSQKKKKPLFWETHETFLQNFNELPARLERQFQCSSLLPERSAQEDASLSRLTTRRGVPWRLVGSDTWQKKNMPRINEAAVFQVFCVLKAKRGPSGMFGFRLGSKNLWEVPNRRAWLNLELNLHLFKCTSWLFCLGLVNKHISWRSSNML